MLRNPVDKDEANSFSGCSGLLWRLEAAVNRYFLLGQDEVHRDLMGENYSYIPSLDLDIHVGISKS